MPSLASCGSGLPVTSLPSSSTRPPISRATPRIAFSSVLFPAPFGPTTATTCPCFTSMATSWTMAASPYPAESPRTESADPRSDAITAASADDISVLHLLAGAQLAHPAFVQHFALGHHDHVAAEALHGVE